MGGRGGSIFLHYAVQILEECEKILEEVESLGKRVFKLYSVRPNGSADPNVQMVEKQHLVKLSSTVKMKKIYKDEAACLCGDLLGGSTSSTPV